MGRADIPRNLEERMGSRRLGRRSARSRPARRVTCRSRSSPPRAGSRGHRALPPADSRGSEVRLERWPIPSSRFRQPLSAASTWIGRPVEELHRVSVAVDETAADHRTSRRRRDRSACAGSTGGGRRAVFEKSDGRDAGEISDLGGHVRLVGVPGLERPRDERRRRQRLERRRKRSTRATSSARSRPRRRRVAGVAGRSAPTRRRPPRRAPADGRARRPRRERGDRTCRESTLDGRQEDCVRTVPSTQRPERPSSPGLLAP